MSPWIEGCQPLDRVFKSEINLFKVGNLAAFECDQIKYYPVEGINFGSLIKAIY